MPIRGLEYGFGAETAIAPIKEGDLIKTPGMTTVYHVEWGMKRGITSPAVFEQCGFKYEGIRILPKEMVDAVPTGPNISGPDPLKAFFDSVVKFFTGGK